MRYMFLIKSEQVAAPPSALIEAMHSLAAREVKAGRMIFDGGLAPPAMGASVLISRGRMQIHDGPFSETKEVIGGFAVFELPDREAAIESARQFMQLHLDHMPDWEGVCEMRPIAGSQVEMIRSAA